ncbi:MAG TPA: glutaredoxin domain-containing protein [Candidatus Magasanikbacteria bacterium]|nr:glutaredoxin domain-containing protein [Candidatus Magasanikbacteria bacterium]
MSHKIVVYSTPTCPYCHMAKDFLTKKGFTFEDKNVALDEAAANDLVEKSGQMGVPVIEIDDQIVIGFDQVALEDLLK